MATTVMDPRPPMRITSDGAESEGCTRLWQAVLARALLDGAGDSGVPPHEREAAKAFLTSTDVVGVIAAAGLEPDWALPRIGRVMSASVPCPSRQGRRRYPDRITRG